MGSVLHPPRTGAGRSPSAHGPWLICAGLSFVTMVAYRSGVDLVAVAGAAAGTSLWMVGWFERRRAGDVASRRAGCGSGEGSHPDTAGDVVGQRGRARGQLDDEATVALCVAVVVSAWTVLYAALSGTRVIATVLSIGVAIVSASMYRLRDPSVPNPVPRRGGVDDGSASGSMAVAAIPVEVPPRLSGASAGAPTSDRVGHTLSRAPVGGSRQDLAAINATPWCLPLLVLIVLEVGRALS